MTVVIETVGDLLKELKQYDKKLRLIISSCPMKLKEYNGQMLALSKCRSIGNLQLGFFYEDRPIFNFAVLDDTEHIEAVDALCLFHEDTGDQESSKEFIECLSKKLGLETGVNSKTTKSSLLKGSTPSEEVTAPVKPTSSTRLYMRRRVTFPGSME